MRLWLRDVRQLAQGPKADTCWRRIKTYILIDCRGLAFSSVPHTQERDGVLGMFLRPLATIATVQGRLGQARCLPQVLPNELFRSCLSLPFTEQGSEEMPHLSKHLWKAKDLYLGRAEKRAGDLGPEESPS